MGLPSTKNMRELWSRIVGLAGLEPGGGRRGVWEPAQRVGVARLVNHHPAWPNWPAAAVPSVDFVGCGLPASGKLHRFWFACCLYSGAAATHMMVMRRVRGIPPIAESIETLPGVGNLVG
jgi:hypothetical protein